MKTVIASAILALFAGSAMATGYGPSVGAGSSVISASSVQGSSRGNSLTISGASNHSFASSQGQTSAGASAFGNKSLGGASGVATGSASATTGSVSGAFNVSTPGATGGAVAIGVATADACVDTGYFASNGKSTVGGSVTGDVVSQSLSGAYAGRNGAALAGAGNTVNFIGGSASVATNGIFWSKVTGTTYAAGTSAGLQGGVAVGNAGYIVDNVGDFRGGAVATGAAPSNCDNCGPNGQSR